MNECITSVFESIPCGCDYEVIVVDNNSTDETSIIIKNSISRYGSKVIKYLVERKQGLSVARNSGICNSSGDLLFFLDDDAILDKNCLSTYCLIFEKFGFNCMGGKILPLPRNFSSKDLPDWFNNSLWGALSMVIIGDKVKRVFYPNFPYGANFVVHRKLFEKYGVFNLSMGRKGKNLISNEEIEFFLRLEENNEPIHFIPDAMVYHLVQKKRLKLSFFVRRFLAQGISDAFMFINNMGVQYTYFKLYNKLYEVVLAIPLFIGRKIADRSNYINPIFKLFYNMGYFYSVFGNFFKIR